MLRTRLVAILAVLVLAGLGASGIVTYQALEHFLLNRVDSQLRAAQGPISRYMSDEPAGDFFSAAGGGSDLPAAVLGEVLDDRGRRVGPPVSFGFKRAHTYVPDLPGRIRPTTGPRIFTTGAIDQPGYRFRVLATSVHYTTNGTDYLPGSLIVAIPLTDVSATLHHLLLIEVIVAAIAVIGLVAVAWWMVRRELRPLEAMGGTAAAIAAGDLSRRVEPAEARTEVGRLGLALNGMLAQIESSMRARVRSEDRLRRFLADASHELRTPLTSIRGYSELFRRGADRRPEDLALSLRRIEEEAARMGVLVEDLLLLAHLDETRPLERERVDLTAVVSDAVADARAVAPERDISGAIEAGVVVEGDESRLRQAVGNLVSNALTHTPEGTPVELMLRVAGGSAVVVVADSGPGLPEGAAGHVFDRFWRGSSSRERGTGGAGLGLSIVAAIVAAHGGEVSAAAGESGGATFSISLPLASTQEGEDRAQISVSSAD